MLGHTIAVRKAPSGTLFAATTVPTIATSAATQISADNNLRTIPAESGRSSQCYCSQFAGSRRQAVQMYCSIVVDPRFTHYILCFSFRDLALHKSDLSTSRWHSGHADASTCQPGVTTPS